MIHRDLIRKFVTVGGDVESANPGNKFSFPSAEECISRRIANRDGRHFHGNIVAHKWLEGVLFLRATGSEVAAHPETPCASIFGQDSRGSCAGLPRLSAITSVKAHAIC